MDWKDVLVFADGSDEGLTRVKLALDLSRAHEAHLEVQVVTAVPQHPRRLVTSALEEVYQNLRRTAVARGAEAVAAIGRLAPIGKTFSAYQCEATFDKVRSAAAAAARSADLVVFGKPAAPGGIDIEAEILMGAVFDGGQPCLMFPRWVTPHVWGRRALIAWKATPQSARAAHAALPLLKRAESVRLLVVDPRADKAGEDHRALMRLATHLARHGVPLEDPVVTHSSLDQVTRAIAEQAEEFGADFLVMGAYGHPRLSEFVFGGVSQDMIRDAAFPVLLAH